MTEMTGWVSPKYAIIDGDDLLEGIDDVLRDQTVQFKGRRNASNYPIPIRRIEPFYFSF